MKQATLCLLLKNQGNQKELLLAMKKRGFGVGKWNGVGGKFDPSKGDKTIIDTAIRETKEEIGLIVNNPQRAAVLNFYFPYVPKDRGWDQTVHVFLSSDWSGELLETDEMKPQWFKLNEIPFEQMWDDDRVWLPLILRDKKLKADFIFKKGEIIKGYKLKFTEGFD